MIQGIENTGNRDRLAIVVVGYNRLDSMKRVLSSLTQAHYPSDQIPLVLSIDCSGDEALYSYVREFDWPYGDKYVNIEKERLGLKKHIFQCCGLSKYFKGVIILEDDSYAAPYFYSYALEAVSRYGENPLVCGISLYVSHNNEYVNIPFFPYNNGNDVFLLQDVQTRGECFTYSQWKRFEEWLPKNENRDYSEVYMPEQIKSWKRAWSKYFYAYMVEGGKYFVYPYTSFITNMGAIGEHGTSVVNVAQVALEWGLKKYIMPDVENLTRYDAFYCNEALYEHLGLSPKELCIDYFGFNPNIQHRRYILTYRSLPYKVVKSYGLHLYPQEMNVLSDVEGDGLYLYDSSEAAKTIKNAEDNYASYIYCRHNVKLMLTFLRCHYIDAIKRRWVLLLGKKK
jgi:hypothetical protein